VLHRTKSALLASSNALKIIWWHTVDVSVSWRYEVMFFGSMAWTPGM